jgi:hypothetical protein
VNIKCSRSRLVVNTTVTQMPIVSMCSLLVHFSDMLQHLVLCPERPPAHVALVAVRKVFPLDVPSQVLPPRTLLLTRVAPVDAGRGVAGDKRVDTGRVQVIVVVVVIKALALLDFDVVLGVKGGGGWRRRQGERRRRRSKRRSKKCWEEKF